MPLNPNPFLPPVQVHWPASIPPPSRLPSSPASSPSVRRSPRPPRAPTNPRNLQLNFVVLKEKVPSTN